MRKKFKIYQNGEKYKPDEQYMVVMNNQGIFFLVGTHTYYPSVQKLSEAIGNYDVVWCDNDTTT